MKNSIALFALFSFIVTAQEKRVSIDDFVKEHQGLEENEQGEIVPINDREINKKVRFFIEEKYLNVEYAETSFGTVMRPLLVPMTVTIITPSLFK